jgi:hypothetical protein
MEAFVIRVTFLLLLATVMSLVQTTSSETEGTTATELLPNLIPLPARDLRVTWENGVRLLKFTTTSWNAGSGPLELRPGQVDSAQGQKLLQRIYNSDGTSADEPINTWMQWHPTHNHFHVNDYAIYTLQTASAPGESLRTGAKTTFCIIDTDRVNLKLPGAPKHAAYTACGLERQGMSVGWGDSYGYWLQGQSLPITGLPDGEYVLKIEIDPRRHFQETNPGDNISTLNLRISGDSVHVLNGGNRGRGNR